MFGDSASCAPRKATIYSLPSHLKSISMGYFFTVLLRPWVCSRPTGLVHGVGNFVAQKNLAWFVCQYKHSPLHPIHIIVGMSRAILPNMSNNPTWHAHPSLFTRIMPHLHVSLVNKYLLIGILKMKQGHLYYYYYLFPTCTGGWATLT